jgi:hypothetical protein
MKTSTWFVVSSALVLFSVGAAAAPPGGGPMGGGTPGGVSGRTPGATPGQGDTGHASDRPTGAQSEGHSISDQLAHNTKLSSEIKELTGTDAQQACAGFMSLGSCVAAAHVSKNLGIPFDTLRSKVTGSGAVSLGRAIHELKPNTNAASAAQAATRQAIADLQPRR